MSDAGEPQYQLDHVCLAVRTLGPVRAMLENRHPAGLTAPGRHAIANILLRHFVGES